MSSDDILATYERAARDFARHRDKTLFERPWLDRFLAHVQPPRRVLDLGCGTGQPIAGYLVDRRARVTGVDGAPAMIKLFEANVPGARAVLADMRGLDLGAQFDGILAWNSLFHLGAADQRAMFATFAAHAAPGAALMFTSGPRAGEALGHLGGQAGGAAVRHESLAPEDYRALFAAHGFSELRYVPEDASARGHTIWLARYTGAAVGRA